jgi:hypothetical protein
MLNEGNQIHNFMSSSGSASVINYSSGSDFLTSYSSGSGSGSGSKSQKVTVPTVPVPVPVPQHWRVAWLILVCGVAQLGCGVIQYRVRRGSVEWCKVAQLRTGRGLVMVRPGSVRVWCGSVQGAAWLSSGCSVAQFRVRRGTVQGAAWLS